MRALAPVARQSPAARMRTPAPRRFRYPWRPILENVDACHHALFPESGHPRAHRRRVARASRPKRAAGCCRGVSATRASSSGPMPQTGPIPRRFAAAIRCCFRFSAAIGWRVESASGATAKAPSANCRCTASHAICRSARKRTPTARRHADARQQRSHARRLSVRIPLRRALPARRRAYARRHAIHDQSRRHAAAPLCGPPFLFCAAARRARVGRARAAADASAPPARRRLDQRARAGRAALRSTIRPSSTASIASTASPPNRCAC